MRIPFRSETVRSLAVAAAGTAGSPVGACGDTAGVGTEPHDCGDCHACCIHLPIPAGEVCPNAKLAGAACPHVTAHGCRNYEGRPGICRQFRCAWLAEPRWPLAWRPDQSGLLCLCEQIADGISAALVYEIQPDAIMRPTTEAILASLKDSTAVVALVNLQQQRCLLHGCQWSEAAEHTVRRPHFLRSIHRAEGSERHEVDITRRAGF